MPGPRFAWRTRRFGEHGSGRRRGSDPRPRASSHRASDELARGRRHSLVTHHESGRPRCGRIEMLYRESFGDDNWAPVRESQFTAQRGSFWQRLDVDQQHASRRNGPCLCIEEFLLVRVGTVDANTQRVSHQGARSSCLWFWRRDGGQGKGKAAADLAWAQLS